MRPLIALSLFVSLGCSRASHAAPVTLHISAASSLREPLEALAARYQRTHHDVTVRLSFGASGDLATQIERGAPVALFASASREPVDRLARSTRLDVLCALAGNELVLIRSTNAALADLRWENLTTHSALTRLALGIAPAVPAGVYAETALRTLGTLETLRPKIVRGGNARQVLDLVARGEAEAGIVYATDARGRSDVVVIGPPPPNARPVVRYPFALMTGAEHSNEARSLGQWMCGPEGREVFGYFGFTAP